MSFKRCSVLAITIFGFFMELAVVSASTEDIQKKIDLANYVNNNQAPRPSIKLAAEARELVTEIHFRVFDVVKEICIEEEIKARDCTWSARVELLPGFQAFAFRANEIVIHSGLIDKISYDDELAFVIAHEIAHHLYNHVAKKRNGMFIGAVLGALTGAGAGTGATIASLVLQSKSSAMEIRADEMAVKIIEEAGYDLAKARFVLLRMAKLDGRSRATILESHPAGLERLLAFDQLVAQERGTR